MYVFASFYYSAFLELAISELEAKGIPPAKILAQPLVKRKEPKKILDTINQADGISHFDGMAALGTVFALFGIIYGYVLRWGPILWGLIGLGLGAALGLLLDLHPWRQANQARRQASPTEVILLVNCDKGQAEMVEEVLWDNQALGVGRLDR